MNEKEKPSQEIDFKDYNELDLPEFFKALHKAITTNNIQTIYGLSKIFARYTFRKQNN